MGLLGAPGAASAVTAVPELRTDRLVLEPLRASHATEMVVVLADPGLHHFMGGDPPTLSALRDRYRKQVEGPSDSPEEWCNWIIRRGSDHRAVGFVQTTIVGAAADVAWVVGVDHQRDGIATEAATAMVGWLRSVQVHTITAHIHPGHVASQRVATAIGLSRSGEVDADGEEVWVSPP